jgi:hypothetical protein
MTYTSANMAIGEALKLLEARGVSCPQDELVQALRDGHLPSWGLVAFVTDQRRRRRFTTTAAAWLQLKPAWWHHLQGSLDNSGVVYFDQRPTKPPAPFRAERIEVPRKLIDKLWPEPLDASAGAGPSALRDSVVATKAHQSQFPELKGAKSWGILEAINQIWERPAKIPKGLSAKERNNKIIAKLRSNGSSVPGDYKAQARAIQRVLQRARPK